MTFNDDLARKCILLLYSRNPNEEITIEDFINLLKTRELVNNRRRDELQKKVWLGNAYHVYSKFKVGTRITNEKAFKKMKAYYNLDTPGKQIILNKLSGQNK